MQPSLSPDINATTARVLDRCGAHVRDYGELLRDDPLYRDKVRRFSELSKDVSEIIDIELKEGHLPQLPPRPRSPERHIAYHTAIAV